MLPSPVNANAFSNEVKEGWEQRENQYAQEVPQIHYPQDQQIEPDAIPEETMDAPSAHPPPDASFRTVTDDHSDRGMQNEFDETARQPGIEQAPVTYTDYAEGQDSQTQTYANSNDASGNDLYGSDQRDRNEQLSYGNDNAQPRYGHNNAQSSYSDNNAQPSYNDGNVQPSYSDGNTQPLFSDGNAQPSYSDNNAQPSYNDGNVQPSHSDGNAQPSYSDGNAQPSYNDGNAQPTYSDNNAQPLYNDDKVQPSYSDGNTQPSYNDNNAQPFYSNHAAQPFYDDNTAQMFYSNDGGYKEPETYRDTNRNAREEDPYGLGRQQTTYSQHTEYRPQNARRMDTSNIIMQPVVQDTEMPTSALSRNDSLLRTASPADTPEPPEPYTASVEPAPRTISSEAYAPLGETSLQSTSPLTSMEGTQSGAVQPLPESSPPLYHSKPTPAIPSAAPKSPTRKQPNSPAKQQVSRTEPRRSTSKHESDQQRSSIAYLNEPPKIEPPMRAPPPVTSALPLPSTSPYFNPYASLRATSNTQGPATSGPPEPPTTSARPKQLRGESRPDSVLGSRYGFDMKAVQPLEDKPLRQQPTPNANPNAVTAKDYSYNIRHEPEGRRLNAGAFRRAPPSASSLSTANSGNGSDGAMSPAARLRDEWRASAYTTPMATPAAEGAQPPQLLEPPESSMYNDNRAESRSNYSHRTSAVDAPTDVVENDDASHTSYSRRESNEVHPLNVRKKPTVPQDSEVANGTGDRPPVSTGGFSYGSYVTALD